jgi:hypothetical protein
MLSKNEAYFIPASPSEGLFDTSTPIGKFAETLMAALSEFEHHQVSARVKGKRAAMIREGRWPGGTAPIGYCIAEQGGLESAQSEVNFLNEIIDMILDGKSPGIIARELNEAQRYCRGGKWTRARVISAVTNTTIIGRLVGENGVTHPGQHKPIVTEERWQRVRAVLPANKRPRIPRRDQRVAPYGGVVLPMHAHGAGKQAYGYYRCLASSKGACKNKKPVNADALDLAVWNELKELLQDAEFGHTLDEILRTRAIKSKQNYQKMFAPLQGELSEIRTRIRRLISAIEEGKRDGAVSERLRQLEDRRKDIEDEVRTLEKERQDDAQGMSNIEFLPLLKRLIAKSRNTPQPAIMRALVGQIRVGIENLEMDLALDKFALRQVVAPPSTIGWNQIREFLQSFESFRQAFATV